MKTHITPFIVATFILVSLQGCTSGRTSNKNLRTKERRDSANKSSAHKRTITHKKEVSVKLSNEGRIYVGNRYTGLKKMVKQLKANGAKKEDRIVINIPKNTSPNALKSIGRELASNGYGHILFKQEHKPSAEIGLDPLIKHLYK